MEKIIIQFHFAEIREKNQYLVMWLVTIMWIYLVDVVSFYLPLLTRLLLKRTNMKSPHWIGPGIKFRIDSYRLKYWHLFISHSFDKVLQNLKVNVEALWYTEWLIAFETRKAFILIPLSNLMPIIVDWRNRRAYY